MKKTSAQRQFGVIGFYRRGSHTMNQISRRKKQSNFGVSERQPRHLSMFYFNRIDNNEKEFIDRQMVIMAKESDYNQEIFSMISFVINHARIRYTYLSELVVGSIFFFC